MKSIRFDRSAKPVGVSPATPHPPHMREPRLKRALQIAAVFAAVFLGGSYLLKHALYRTYRGIIVGDQTELVSREKGFIQANYVRDHQPFLAGVPLMRIESPDLRQSREALEREIGALAATLETSYAEDLEALRAAMSSAKAAAARADAERQVLAERRAAAEAQLQKTQLLFEESAATAATLEARRRALEEAALGLVGADERLLEARQQVELSTSRLQQALQAGSRRKREDELRLQSARAELQALQTREPTLTVTGVRGGVVSRVYKLEGDAVEPGDPLLSLVYEGGLWVEAYVDPDEIEAAKPGTAVNLVIGEIVEIPMKGEILSVGPATRPIPLSHRDKQERLDHFAVARISLDWAEASRLGFRVGQFVAVQVPRW